MLRPRRPTVIAASSYYVLAAALSIAVFFVVWDLLIDGRYGTPVVAAGLSSSAVLFTAVILRELIIRLARRRSYLKERNADRYGVPNFLKSDGREPGKLTIEQNTAILGIIKQKSEAAKVLNTLAAAHREVFELCGEYIARNETELSRIRPDSPRLAPLLRGRTTASECHRFHLLRWAEIETRQLSGEARTRVNVSDRIEAGQSAIGVLDMALGHYPAESRLSESRALLVEFVASIKIADLAEKAERAEARGQTSRAITLYEEALFTLGRDNPSEADREQALRRINDAIQRLRQLETHD